MPKYTCWPDGDEPNDYDPIEERYPEWAAEEFAKQHMDMSEAPFEMTVFVREEGDATTRKYEVTVDWSPTYHATAI